MLLNSDSWLQNAFVSTATVFLKPRCARCFGCELLYEHLFVKNAKIEKQFANSFVLILDSFVLEYSQSASAK